MYFRRFRFAFFLFSAALLLSSAAFGQLFTQQGGKLVGTGAINTPYGANQGLSVALSGDGNTALLGGPEDNGTGAVWVYTRNSSGTWTQQGNKLVGSGAVNTAPYGALQGSAVALSADGNTALVGGPNDNNMGAVWVFTRDGSGNWTQQGSKLVGTGYSAAPNAVGQGHSVALSADGNTALVGGPGDGFSSGTNYGTGAVWVFTRDGNGNWTQQGTKLVGSGAVGAAGEGVSVALSADGNTALVGGSDDNSFAGAVWVFTRDGNGNWSPQGSKMTGSGAAGGARQGFSVALSGDGNTALAGGPADNPGYPASGQGAAWFFTRDSNGNWSQQGSKLTGSGNAGAASQGYSVALSTDGQTALVAGPGDNNSAGAVWAFTRDSSGNWSQQGNKLAGSGAVGTNGADQGASVGLSRDGATALVGGPVDNNSQGAAWVFARAPSFSTGALRFVAVTPCRVADTRNANGPFGGPLLPGQTSRDFAIQASGCSIPSTAQAYALNVTVVPTAALRFLTVWPSGSSQPSVSTLNSFDGRIKANAAIVPAGANGAISVFATDDTHVILDITGYFVPASGSSDLSFYPLTPCRVADTRVGTGALGGPSMTTHQSRDFPIQSSSCNVPSTAQAYSLNFTVVPKGPLSFLTAWPTGQSQPNVSTLNAPTGTFVANAAIVPAGSNGAVSVYVTDNTDVVIDINGYFAAPGTGGLSLYNLTPCRVLDTRTVNGGQPLTGALAVTVPSSSCGVPAAAAYVFNVTVVPSGSLIYLSLWPAGVAAPVVSTLNAPDGAVTSNMAIVPADTNGALNVYTSNTSHAILDIFGYFAP